METERRFVAIGVNLGLSLEGTELEIKVRLGRRIVGLGADEARLWMLASTPQLLAETLNAVSSKVDGGMAALIENGLLAELPRAGHELDFADAVRLQTHARVLGEDQQRPGAYTLASNTGEPLVRLDPWTFEIWVNSDGRSLGEVCRDLARRRGQSPERVAAHALNNLEVVLDSGVASLDASVA